MAGVFVFYNPGTGGGVMPPVGGAGGVCGIWKRGANAGIVLIASHCGIPCVHAIVWALICPD